MNENKPSSDFQAVFPRAESVSMSVSARWGRLKGYFRNTPEMLQCFLSAGHVYADVCFPPAAAPQTCSKLDGNPTSQIPAGRHQVRNFCCASLQRFPTSERRDLGGVGSRWRDDSAITEQNSNLQIATSRHVELVFQTEEEEDEEEDRSRLKRATASKMEVLMRELQTLMKHNGKRVSIFSNRSRLWTSSLHLNYHADLQDLVF